MAPPENQHEKPPAEETVEKTGGILLEDFFAQAAKLQETAQNILEARKIQGVINALCDAGNVEWSRVDTHSTNRVRQAVQLGYDKFQSIEPKEGGVFLVKLTNSSEVKTPEPGIYPWTRKESPGEIYIKYRKDQKPTVPAAKEETVAITEPNENEETEKDTSELDAQIEANIRATQAELETAQTELKEQQEKWRGKWDRVTDRDMEEVIASIQKTVDMQRTYDTDRRMLTNEGEEFPSYDANDDRSRYFADFMRTAGVPANEQASFQAKMETAFDQWQHDKGEQLKRVMVVGAVTPNFAEHVKRIYGYIPPELNN